MSVVSFWYVNNQEYFLVYSLAHVWCHKIIVIMTYYTNVISSSLLGLQWVIVCAKPLSQTEIHTNVYISFHSNMKCHKFTVYLCLALGMRLYIYLIHCVMCMPITTPVCLIFAFRLELHVCIIQKGEGSIAIAIQSSSDIVVESDVHKQTRNWMLFWVISTMYF